MTSLSTTKFNFYCSFGKWLLPKKKCKLFSKICAPSNHQNPLPKPLHHPLWLNNPLAVALMLPVLPLGSHPSSPMMMGRPLPSQRNKVDPFSVPSLKKKKKKKAYADTTFFDACETCVGEKKISVMKISIVILINTDK
jgi:hypothetical protein